METIFLGADHRGFELKEEVKRVLSSMQEHYIDVTPNYIDGDDYPDIALEVCKNVLKEEGLGILICGSGIGMSMAANKIPGIRAALCNNKEQARLSKKDEDPNVLVLSKEFESGDVKEIIETWLNTEFGEGRHRRRIDKIRKIERTYSKYHIA
jgi:ribose 5-phosphate isomerase B